MIFEADATICRCMQIQQICMKTAVAALFKGVFKYNVSIKGGSITLHKDFSFKPYSVKIYEIVVNRQINQKGKKTFINDHMFRITRNFYYLCFNLCFVQIYEIVVNEKEMLEKNSKNNRLAALFQNKNNNKAESVMTSIHITRKFLSQPNTSVI